MISLLLLLIALILATTGLFAFNTSYFNNSNERVITDKDIGETIELEDFNGKTLKLSSLKKKGKIRIISKTEDLVNFKFNGRYNIEETGNSCSEQIECKPGEIEEEKIKEKNIEMKNVEMMISNFIIEIDNYGIIPEIDIKAYNVDNLNII